MKKFISSKIILGIVAVGMIAVLSSCLSNNTKSSSVVQAYLQLNEATSIAGSDTMLTAGNDSITITTVRLFNGKSTLIRQQNSTPIPLGPSVVRFSTVSSAAGGLTGNTQSLIGRGYSGPQLAGVYHEVDFNIDQAPDSLKDVLKTIFYDGGNYSMIIKGKYDNSEFTFRSEQNFHQQLSQFTPVQLPEYNAGVAFIVQADVRGWFLNNNGQGFLDPSDSKNAAAINANIQGSFHVKTKTRGTSTGAGTP
jgi:hypothetical protein